VKTLSFLIIQGTKYRVDALVVVKLDGSKDIEANKIGYWT